MNILGFSNCPLNPMLGSGKTRLAWRAGLIARGHRVRVVDSVELLGTAGKRGQRWRLACQAWRWLSAMPAAERAEVDLIEFYGAEFWLPTWWLAATGKRVGRGRPLLVAHTDGLEPLATARLRAAGLSEVRPKWRARASEGCDRLAFSWADGLVVGCEADRRFALGDALFRDPDRVVTVNPGLDEEFLQAAGEGNAGPAGTREERVAFLGSWIVRKGTRWLVAILNDLLRARPGLRVNLGGLGRRIRPDAVLETFAPEFRARVEVLPDGASTAACVAMLSRSRVFLFPSEYEGFGLALAEAMACGCAVVTTPTGLGAELRDGEEALVCPFGDAAALRAAVERLLDDAPLRDRLAAAGQARICSLRWAGSVQRLEEVYLDWLQRSPS